MDYEHQFKARFLFFFCLIGLLNAFLISQIYFYETKKALISRASAQLVSVRELFQTRFASSNDFKGEEDLSPALSLRAGMGASGEIYVVDSNFLIHSISRFGPQWRNASVKNKATIAALNNKSGVAMVKDYRGVEVISAYAPLLLKNQKLALLCEMDLEEVLLPLKQTKKKILVITIFLILGTFGLSLLLSSRMIRFLRKMRDQINLLNKEKNQEINRTSLKIIEAQEEERAKISHDVHDGIGQLITSLKWQLSLKNNDSHQFDDMITLCDKVISEVRSISHNVVPSVLKDFGIFPALDSLFSGLQGLKTPSIHFNASDTVRDINFKQSFEINLYRIIQELIQNGLKHSGAKDLKIHLQLDGSQLVIVYEDSGKGMSENLFPPKSLDYRAKLFDGDLINKESETGLHILIRFKLTEISNENIHH